MSDDNYLDCGDSSCLFALKRTGMRTNGGCRCLKDIDNADRRRAVQRRLLEWDDQRKRLAAVERERDEAVALMMDARDHIVVHCGKKSDRCERIVARVDAFMSTPAQTATATKPTVKTDMGCVDHWHCDPTMAAHLCKSSHSGQCPSCGERAATPKEPTP